MLSSQIKAVKYMLFSQIKAAKFLSNFTANQCKHGVATLSTYSDNLLVGCSEDYRLYIFSRKGQYLANVTLNNTDWVRDAIWTPNGNIIFSPIFGGKIVTLSKFGYVIATTILQAPYCFSVSNDDIIYITEFETGVYQSTDGGLQWSLVFKPTVGWHCFMTIKVIANNSADFWTLETADDRNFGRLRVYSFNIGRLDGYVTWKDIDTVNITSNGEYVDIIATSLSYDGYGNVFLGDIKNKAVYVFLVSGQYHCQLMLSERLKYDPNKLYVDNKHQLLYVPQSKGLVSVFKLIYNIDF